MIDKKKEKKETLENKVSLSLREFSKAKILFRLVNNKRENTKSFNIYEKAKFSSNIENAFNNDYRKIDIEYDTIHETQKPVKLIEYLLNTFSNEQETVLDNTMGSGTTGIGCINTNRKFIGIEIEKKYFDLSVERIKDHLHS